MLFFLAVALLVCVCAGALIPSAQSPLPPLSFAAAASGGPDSGSANTTVTDEDKWLVLAEKKIRKFEMRAPEDDGLAELVAHAKRR